MKNTNSKFTGNEIAAFIDGYLTKTLGPENNISDTQLLKNSNLHGWVIEQKYFEDMIVRNGWNRLEFGMYESIKISGDNIKFIRVLEMPKII